ncbi:hypothetical protein [Pseudomonas orientalis]|uniref:hypothetical protein n=1 Tax=Pseudomonas orientalis TaxID=76758 RepID=UPI000F55BA1A|nr:hypothetical protein [Pseudomonas orientalis]
MTLWLYPLLSILGVFLAFSLRVLLSSKKLGYTKFFLGMIPNMLAMRTHYKIADLDIFPLLGHRPEIIESHIFIGWLALACFLLHAGAFPVKYDLHWWWKKPK